MNVFDLHNTSKVYTAFNSQSIVSDTTTTGNIIDTKGFESLEFIMTSGVITDGAYTINMQEGDESSLSDVATVAAAEVLGSIDFALTEDNISKRVGYVGKKRYVRITNVSSNTSSGGVFSGVAILANASHQPVANQ